MTSTNVSSRALAKFQQAAQSLKLYRRAEIQDDSGRNPIEELYVDPLPNEAVLETILRPNTTVLIGRKGTGKSTIFQRAQHEIALRRRNTISAYVDIKTVFEQSQVDPDLLVKLSAESGAMSGNGLNKLLLYRAFIDATISEIKREIDRRLGASLTARLVDGLTGNSANLFARLDSLLEQSRQENFINIDGIRVAESSSQEETKKSYSQSLSLTAEATQTPKANAGASASRGTEASDIDSQKYSTILMRTFNLPAIIAELEKILAAAGIRHLYVFVDDFSELPREHMKIVVDSLIAPLNNWSNELIKFKIASYPGRIYYGQIDKGKIDEVSLDSFSLYGAGDVSTMEDKAIDFTKRIVSKRIAHYTGRPLENFFEDDPDMWRYLFYATMANPRNLGYILYYLYELNLIYNKKINLKAIRDAAQRYFEEKIEPYFKMSKFLHESFEERSSIYGLKELLEKIVNRSRELKNYRGSVAMSIISGTPPTSHFSVPVEYDDIFSTLELNFFLTKYFEMKNRDGRLFSVYALNFGLCQKHSLTFNRPLNSRIHRLYFVERIFDYSVIIRQYLSSNQEIICDNCQHKFDLEQLDALKLYKMACPECMKGTCRVINLSRKYADILNEIGAELLLPATDLGILKTLHDEGETMHANEIAEELDTSYQLVGKRAKILDERGLVTRTPEGIGRRRYKITERAEDIYFSSQPDDGLILDDES